MSPTICFSKTQVTGTYPESKKLLLLGKFGFCNCGSESLCASAPFLQGALFRLELQGDAQVVHVTYQGCGLFQEKTNPSLPTACSSHQALPAAMGLLWASWGSSFILPVVLGAPALPETCAHSLPGWQWKPCPCLGGMCSKNLKYYIFPTGASEDAGLSG